MVRRPGRPRMNGDGRKAPKHTRTSVSNEMKLEIVRFFDSHGMAATRSQYYKTLNDNAWESRRKLIYQWCKVRETLESRCSVSRVAQLKSTRPLGIGTVLDHEQEMELVGWINMLREDSVPVSATMLQLKAQEVAAVEKIAGFVASWHWRTSFLNRHNLSVRARTRQVQIKPEDAERAAIAFGATVRRKMGELGITRVHNADQTGTTQLIDLL